MDELVAQLRAAGCVFAEEEAAVLRSVASSSEELRALAERRMAGEPLEHLVGWAAFDGLRVRVAPGVFVPRLRTTLLVRVAAGLLAAGDVVVDLGCGAGAIGAAVAARVPGVEVWAVDIDPAAVACARENLPFATVLEGDLFTPLPEELRGRVDVLVANTPYVPSDMVALMPPEAKDHEPLHTLDGGPDGLALLRRIAAGADDWLAPGGVALIEISETQYDAARHAFETAGLTTSARIDPDGTSVIVGQRGNI